MIHHNAILVGKRKVEWIVESEHGWNHKVYVRISTSRMIVLCRTDHSTSIEERCNCQLQGLERGQATNTITYSRPEVVGFKSKDQLKDAGIELSKIERVIA